MTVPDKLLDALAVLGLTGFESEVYVHLLQDSPATGYRVAQALRRAPANVYRVIESLVEKGAVEVDEGDKRVFRPIPVEEFLDRVQRRFRNNRSVAEELLLALPGPRRDARAYQLYDREQVLGRTRRMIDDATSVLLVESFPEPLLHIKKQLAAAASRGVQVFVLVFEPIEIAGVETVLHPAREVIIERWPAQFLNLVKDGEELLLALLHSKGGEVIQCVWSQSPFLAWTVHSGLHGQLGYAAMRRGLLQGEELEQIWALVDRLIDPAVLRAPGYLRLLEQIGRPGLQSPGSDIDADR